MRPGAASFVLGAGPFSTAARRRPRAANVMVQWRRPSSTESRHRLSILVYIVAAVRFLVIVSLIAMTVLPVRADDREDARRAFAAGQAADKRGAWQEAIEHYLRAND